tara:strand:+ start:3472 stop:5118 length:1647 start_codon:yes stop_codon:yes gene_type:complete
MEYNPAALPLISLSLHSTKPTDVPIVGVLRDDGTVNDGEDGMNRDKWIMAISPAATVNGTRGKERLNTIVDELLSRSNSAESLSARWRRSVGISMAYKREKYTALKAKKEVQLEDAHAKVMAFVAMAKEGATDAERMAGGATPNWDIAEKVNSTWQTLVTQIAATDKIIHKALERQTRINASSDFRLLRNKFAEAIAELVSDYGKLDALLDGIADLIESFISVPMSTSTGFLNFVIMGKPGTGKTRMAGKLGSVLGKLGLLVYDQVVEAGRSDFIAEYEGQTAVKTRKFLVSNLEKIIFLDEAYSLTSWEEKPGVPRKLSAFSGEAVAEIIAFMSQHVGCSSFMAAGYEKEMTEDFLPSNSGFDRRITRNIWIPDYTSDELWEIYLKSLAEAMSDPPPAPPLLENDMRNYFTASAKAFLTNQLDVVVGEDLTTTRYPLVSKYFSAQAGAMVTLASTTAILIGSKKGNGQIGTSSASLNTYAIGYVDMYNIQATLFMQRFGRLAVKALTEIQTIATNNGWIVSGQWTVPSGYRTTGDMVPAVPGSKRRR